MRMSKPVTPAPVAEDKTLMEKILAGGHIEYKYAVRLQTVLNRAKGISPGEIAKCLGIHINSIRAFAERYNESGIDSLLKDRTRKPGTLPISDGIKNKVIEIACHEKPADATRWSTRKLAKRAGISHNKVSEILKRADIKPHIHSYYSFSNDPDFEFKLRDVAGLYMNPPDNSIVLCVDEKTRIQAPERARHTIFPQQNLPSRQSNDYYRHGTTTLFTAPDYLNGNVTGDCKNSHNPQYYLDFIKKSDKQCES